MSSLSTRFLTYISTCGGSITCNISKISRRALNNTSSRCIVPKSSSCTLRKASTRNSRSILCIKRCRTTEHTTSIIQSKSSNRTICNTYFTDIVNVIVWKASLNTGTISCDILNVISIRTHVNTQFDIRVTVTKKLCRPITRTIRNTLSCQRISKLTCRTLTCSYTKFWICRTIYVRICRTFRYTFVLNIC